MVIFQISLVDFKFWAIYRTIKEFREGERDCLYPPRFRIKCTQLDTSKSLYSSLEISKRFRVENSNIKQVKAIGEIPLIKKAAGITGYHYGLHRLSL